MLRRISLERSSCICKTVRTESFKDKSRTLKTGLTTWKRKIEKLHGNMRKLKLITRKLNRSMKDSERIWMLFRSIFNLWRRITRFFMEVLRNILQLHIRLLSWWSWMNHTNSIELGNLFPVYDFINYYHYYYHLSSFFINWDNENWQKYLFFSYCLFFKRFLSVNVERKVSIFNEAISTRAKRT